MNVDKDIVQGGCNKEVLSDGIIGEQEIDGNADGVMNDSDESSTNRVIRTVLTNSGEVWEEVCWKDFG